MIKFYLLVQILPRNALNSIYDKCRVEYFGMCVVEKKLENHKRACTFEILTAGASLGFKSTGAKLPLYGQNLTSTCIFGVVSGVFPKNDGC